MLRSNKCHLENMNRAGLIAAKEDCNEFGGYFICNGIEKILRCLI